LIYDTSKEPELDSLLRPRNWEGFVGRDRLESLFRARDAARARGEPMDHVLLFGPSGTGKTTIADLLSNFTALHIPPWNAGEMEGNIAYWFKKNPGKTLFCFIDEVHALPRRVQERLYDLLDRKEKYLFWSLQQIELGEYTFLGATTEPHKLSIPFRERFGIQIKLDFYPEREIEEILAQSARKLGLELQEDARRKLASLSRGVPRIANRLLRRCQDLGREVTLSIVGKMMELNGIHHSGLTDFEIKILRILARFSRPLGLNSLAGMVGENPKVIQEIYEPYLIRGGFMYVTTGGRKILPRGMEVIDESK